MKGKINFILSLILVLGVFSIHISNTAYAHNYGEEIIIGAPTNLAYGADTAYELFYNGVRFDQKDNGDGTYVEYKNITLNYFNPDGTMRAETYSHFTHPWASYFMFDSNATGQVSGYSYTFNNSPYPKSSSGDFVIENKYPQIVWGCLQA